MKNNKELISRFYSEVVNKGDLATMKLILSEKFIDHYAAPDASQGQEGFRNFLQMVTQAFPDLNVVVDDLISEGDQVVARLTIRGTQTGLLMGRIPPSGKPAVWNGIDIFKVQNGLIAERWSLRDMLGMMRQVGALK